MNPLHNGASVYTQAGEAALRLFTLILRICRFSGGSKLIALLNVTSSITGQRCKDKHFF